MATVRSLLVAGNDKLSQAIQHFDLPAGVRRFCPGMTPVCRSVCYALSGRFAFPQVQERLRFCYAVSRRPDFPQWLIAEIRRKGAAFVVRLHVSGDFYAPGYVQKWISIVRECRTTRFYAYTRSWRRPGFAAVLAELAALPNFRLWYSADRHSGYPEAVPEDVSVAWLQDREEESPDPRSDLLFRVRPLRKLRLELPVVPLCPHELPEKAEPVNCGVCGICWDR